MTKQKNDNQEEYRYTCPPAPAKEKENM